MGLEHNLRPRRLHLELRLHADEHGASLPHLVPAEARQVRPGTRRSLPLALRALQSTTPRSPESLLTLESAFQAPVQEDGRGGVRTGHVTARR